MLLQDGTVRAVRVSKVTQESVEYFFPGESVLNVLSIADIHSIRFMSGRLQQFSKQGSVSQPTTQEALSTSTPEKGVIAVLPVHFLDKAGGVLLEEHGKLAQERVNNFLSKEPERIAPLKTREVRALNAVIRKAGVPFSQLNEMTAGELTNLTGSEYAVFVAVTMETNEMSTSNQSTWGSGTGSGSAKTSSVTTTTTSNSNRIYNYTVKVEIYQGANRIFSQSRSPLLHYSDSWLDAAVYLLKRSPIYKR